MFGFICAIAGRTVSLTALAGLAAVCAAGCGGGNDELAAAIDRYRSVMREDMAHLAAKTDALAGQIEDGELGKAQSRYAMARVRYSRVEPLAEELFGPLDVRIDAGSDQVPPDELAGFHRIERAMWRDEETDGLGPVARRLHADVEELRSGVETAELDPLRIARGASNLIAELPTEMLAGDLEPFADCDLVDAAANVEGAEAAFEAVRPSLAEHDEALVAELEARFQRALSALDEYGTLFRDPEQTRAAAPGASFIIYSEISPSERRKLAQRIDALAEPLAQAATEVADDASPSPAPGSA